MRTGAGCLRAGARLASGQTGPCQERCPRGDDPPRDGAELSGTMRAAGIGDPVQGSLSRRRRQVQFGGFVLSAADAGLFLLQVLPRPRTAVPLAAGFKQGTDSNPQLPISLRVRRLGVIAPGVVAVARDLEDAAERRNRDVGLLRVDEGKPQAFSLPKKAAFLRISLSKRSCRFSLRSRASSSRSAVVSPADLPRSDPPAHGRARAAPGVLSRTRSLARPAAQSRPPSARSRARPAGSRPRRGRRRCRS